MRYKKANKTDIDIMNKTNISIQYSSNLFNNFNCLINCKRKL